MHLLHLVPRWQNSERHVRLKTIMQDRPDLIQSELAGLAFDSLQQAFRPVDIERALAPRRMQPETDEMLFVSIDPAAGGPQSDYCVISFVRQQGCVKVRTSAHEILLPERAHEVERCIQLRLEPPREHALVQCREQPRRLVLVERARAQRERGALEHLRAQLRVQVQEHDEHRLRGGRARARARDERVRRRRAHLLGEALRAAAQRAEYELRVAAQQHVKDRVVLQNDAPHARRSSASTRCRHAKVHAPFLCVVPARPALNTRAPAEPVKQFALVEQHIDSLRRHHTAWYDSPVYIYVERNLGFEAEHHQRALDHLPGVCFRLDPQAKRVGMLTTQSIKHAACELLNYMLREDRLHVAEDLVSRDAKAVRAKLRDQLEIFSYQWKSAETVFQQDRCALSGKIGGMKDDIIMALMLGVYFTQLDRHQGNVPRRL